MSRRGGWVALVAALAVLLAGVWWTFGAEPSAAPPPRPGAQGRIRPVEADLVARGAGAVPKERLAQGSRAIGPRGDPLSRVAVTPPVMLPNEALRVEIFQVDQEGVTAAVASRREDLQQCYETARFHAPGLGGRMVLEMQLEPLGDGAPFARVASVDVESALDATMLEGCVATVFEELKFAAAEPTTLRYPVQFVDTPEAR